jgi:uncharacterized hydrophobic protein (TIGR00271 family)
LEAIFSNSTSNKKFTFTYICPMIFETFRIENQESHERTTESINASISFRGNNLWILICAIFIASIGLNVNSIAVIIGAMLISPLMGPIVGIGLGLGTYDLILVKRALKNFGFAVLTALLTSTLYFIFSPINEAHSELLARTTPTIWDVLIALFGGFAGIIAIISKDKGNVLPGVAIATALMPPLCTAGYGIAHLEWTFIAGAFYLFFVNTVFICISTFTVVQILKFPIHKFSNQGLQRRIKRFVFVVVVFTIVPCGIIAVRVVQENHFKQKATDFIANETLIPDNFLLQKNIDIASKKINLIYVGIGLPDSSIKLLKKNSLKYGLDSGQLYVHEGFAIKTPQLNEDPGVFKYEVTINTLHQELRRLRFSLDSAGNTEKFKLRLLNEAKAEHPSLENFAISPLIFLGHGHQKDSLYIAYGQFSKPINHDEKVKFENWLSIKLEGKKIRLIIDKK